MKTKYDVILALMKDELPSFTDEAKELTKDYPHTKEEMTKMVLSPKLKAFRVNLKRLLILDGEVGMDVWFYL